MDRKSRITLMVLLPFILTACAVPQWIAAVMPIDGMIQAGRATDDYGATEFTDAETGEPVTIKLVDWSDFYLEGYKVHYLHGEQYPYEAFFVFNREGNLHAAEFYPHNSMHTIVVEPGVIHAVNPNQEAALVGYLNDMGGREKDTYLGTISCMELNRVNSNLQTTGKVVKSVLKIIFKAAGIDTLILDLSMAPFADDAWTKKACQEADRWDWYSSFTRLSGTQTFIYLPSQPPQMKMVEVAVAQDQMTARWHAEDAQSYPDRHGYKLTDIDHTVFEGPTSFSDLIYHYRITLPDGSMFMDWVATPLEEMQFQVIPNVDFFLEVYATDEAGNQSWVFQKQIMQQPPAQVNSEPPDAAPSQADAPVNIAGSWNVEYDWYCEGADNGDVEIVFGDDYGFEMIEWSGNDMPSSGTWELDGDQLLLYFDSGVVYHGWVEGDTVEGTMSGSGDMEGCWSAERQD